MTQGRYELIKGWVYPRTTNAFDLCLGLASFRRALVDLVLSLADEGVEEVV